LLHNHKPYANLNCAFNHRLKFILIAAKNILAAGQAVTVGAANIRRIISIYCHNSISINSITADLA
jgi:hypothetical protein